MGQGKVSHHPGAPERHRVGGGQSRRQSENLPDRGDRLLHIAAAQPSERPHALAEP
jgi:hypothetical protein